MPKGELVLELRDSTDSLIFEKREKVTISSAVAWEKLVSDLEIKEDGNLKVYIDNSSSDKVFFDEFVIERTEATRAVVVQENHYYPFGMNMKGIEELDLKSLNSEDEHRFQYNGKEKEESFGLNWTDYGWRNMDTQLGRFTKIDRFSEKYYSLSSYNYVGNNPISRIDINGDSISISGDEAKEFFKQLKASTGLRLKMDTNGKVTAKGKAKTDADKMLLESINSENIIVGINATSSNFTDMGFFVGGAFKGSKVNEDGKVIASQIVNPKMTKKIDEFYEAGEGVSVLHEVLEAYIGAKDSPNTSSRITFEDIENKTPDGMAYLNAHDKANALDPRHKEVDLVKDPNTGHIFMQRLYQFHPDIPPSKIEKLINDLSK